MLTIRQRHFYFGLWKQAARRLMNDRETWTKDEENKRRHEVTVRALGRDKSSNDFTHRDFDKVIAELRAIIDPSDLRGQLRQDNMHVTRMRFGLRKLMAELQIGHNYVAEIIHTMNAEGKLGSNNIDNLGVDDLRKVMIALRQHSRRQSRIYVLDPA